MGRKLARVEAESTGIGTLSGALLPGVFCRPFDMDTKVSLVTETINA